MEEVWKPIKGLEGLYEISSKGRVKSLARQAGNVYKKEKIVKPRKDIGGYLSVSIGLPCKYYNKRLHRLVAEAFIPNPSNLPQVNHLDEDKSNNCVDNLEWCSARYNMNYGTAKMRKWDSRRSSYVVVNSLGEIVRTYLDNTSYKPMLSDGIKKYHRLKANKGFLVPLPEGNFLKRLG